jgi:hypothetical protein
MAYPLQGIVGIQSLNFVVNKRPFEASTSSEWS